MTATASDRYPRKLTPAYHAHIYFDAGSLAQAKDLRARIAREFGQVQLGRVHEKEVGPHPRWSAQVAFDASEFDRLVPWLDANRGDLDVFVHGLSGDELADHTTYAWWLGREWPLRLEIFQRKAEGGVG